MKTYRKLRVGETIRETDYMSSKENQGDRTWKAWTASIESVTDSYSASGGWLRANAHVGQKVEKDSLLAYAR
jgi:hypothetical protein